MLIIRLYPKIMSNVNVQCIQFEERFASAHQQALCAACVFHTSNNLNDIEWKQVSLSKLYFVYLFFSFLLLLVLLSLVAVFTIHITRLHKSE